ncbi:hypothetical protein RD792_012415 [Penstemon davidsonii]|uniref:Fungal lipase-type domain-containing protein n=1 Tax=Penstemon davidsonii TaxID=160366 RepID=A0ABR0CXK9_9LAMI|nr:hypothetical protein RD792_012415 [Penstemon davidsonii]
MNTTHAFMFRNKNIDPNLIMVAFKGTDPLDTDEWRIDIDISWYKFRGVGRIHGGFMKALGLQKNRSMPKEIPSGSSPEKSFAYYTIREKLKNLISENKDAKFIVTGHSLGGALAILFASVLAIHGEELLLRKLEGVYTFGQPRVGDEEFGEVPYDDKTFLFKHFGPCLYFDSCYKGQVLGEEPNRNYFSLLYVVPKILNAIFEVIRGFILPWRKGKEYKEGWFMKLLRITLVPAPGVINHCPVDYVNSTRLGELPSSIYSQGPNLNLKQD